MTLQRKNETADKALRRIEAKPDGYRVLATPEGQVLLERAAREAQLARKAARE